MKDELQRLDALLVERGFVESRSRAQGLILSGSVRVGDRVVTKAGFGVAPDEPLVIERGDGFVSRAGEKLDGALDERGAARDGCWRWTWATGSSTGRSGTMIGS
jgi:23S rRNA (cytidine1920-2'-O)/16S rRNA (cytidine1409-2'-O)-methyltransferase